MVNIDKDGAEEIYAYGDIVDFINQQNLEEETGEQLFRFKEIIGHQGPLKKGDKGWNHSMWNVMIAWEDGSQTYEPLDMIAKDSPVICARYAKDKGLLDKPGWKRFKRLAMRDQKMIRMLNQAHLVSIRRGVIYKYGYQVPRSPKEAIEFDKKNGNTKWQDSMALELLQLDEYNTFKDMGKNVPPPIGYKRIRCHFVFDIKHDGRHKSRLLQEGI